MPTTRLRTASALLGAVVALGLAPAAVPAASAAPTPTRGTTAPGVASAPSSVSAVVDPTRTRKARASRAHRSTIPLEVWASSPYARMVARRESGGNCAVVNWAGPWRGKWQMTDSLWRAYGGRDYARHPEKATCEEQDAVAYAIWVASGWAPWGG